MNQKQRCLSLFSIYFVASIDNCGYTMVFALFPPLLLNPEYGFLNEHPTLLMQLFAMGALYAAFPIAQFIGAPILGDLADRYGRKSIFYFSTIGTVAAFVLSGLFVIMKSVILLFIARFITGLFSGNQGLCNASIADLSPTPKQRARNFGLLTVVWGASFPIALVLGGLLSDSNLSPLFSPSLPFYIIALLSLLSLICLKLFFVETYRTKKSSKSFSLLQGMRNIVKACKLPDTKYFFLLMLLWTLGWGYTITWYGAYSMHYFGKNQAITTIGLMVQGIGWILGGALAKPLLLRKYDYWPIAKFSYAATAILLAVASCMPKFELFIAFYSLSALLASVALSSTFNLISIASPATVQGKSMGISQSMQSLGFFLVPILGSATGAISIYSIYPIAATFLASGFLLLLFLKRPAGATEE